MRSEAIDKSRICSSQRADLSAGHFIRADREAGRGMCRLGEDAQIPGQYIKQALKTYKMPKCKKEELVLNY